MQQQEPNVLLKIADFMEENLEMLARVETIDNGKALRECRAADLPLCVDHFRYFAGAIRQTKALFQSMMSIPEHQLTRAIRCGGTNYPLELPIIVAIEKLPQLCSRMLYGGETR